jgi:hypothetical protein
MRWRMCEVRRRALRTPTSYLLQGLLTGPPSSRHKGKLFLLILAKNRILENRWFKMLKSNRNSKEEFVVHSCGTSVNGQSPGREHCQMGPKSMQSKRSGHSVVVSELLYSAAKRSVGYVDCCRASQNMGGSRLLSSRKRHTASTGPAPWRRTQGLADVES